MNIRNILMMVLLSLMSGTTIKAQFNTVGCLYNHPANKTKNPQETNASPIVDNACGANGIVGFLDSYNTPDEAIYIVKDGSGVGSVAYVKGKCSATGTLNILTAKQDYSLQFLYYMLKVFNFEPYKTGMAIPHIYFKDYSKAKIFCLSYSKQLRYAKMLEAIDAKLLIEQKVFISLNSQKQYLLRLMFI